MPTVQERLTAEWNQLTKDIGPVKVIVKAGQAVWDEYLGGLTVIYRDITTEPPPQDETQPHLAFKSAKIVLDKSMDPDTFTMEIDSARS